MGHTFTTDDDDDDDDDDDADADRWQTLVEAWLCPTSVTTLPFRLKLFHRPSSVTLHASTHFSCRNLYGCNLSAR